MNDYANLDVGLTWIRRDIRLHDHAALSACMKQNRKNFVVFVFDDTILKPLLKKGNRDQRLHFIAEETVNNSV